MTKICKDCYWYKPNSSYSVQINCLNDFRKTNESGTCEDFILEKDYEPTGIWAEMAQVVEAVAKEVKRKELDI